MNSEKPSSCSAAALSHGSATVGSRAAGFCGESAALVGERGLRHRYAMHSCLRIQLVRAIDVACHTLTALIQTGQHGCGVGTISGRRSLEPTCGLCKVLSDTATEPIVEASLFRRGGTKCFLADVGPRLRKSGCSEQRRQQQRNRPTPQGVSPQKPAAGLLYTGVPSNVREGTARERQQTGTGPRRAIVAASRDQDHQRRRRRGARAGLAHRPNAQRSRRRPYRHRRATLARARRP